jgi:hypothetical protein
MLRWFTPVVVDINVYYNTTLHNAYTSCLLTIFSFILLNNPTNARIYANNTVQSCPRIY